MQIFSHYESYKQDFDLYNFKKIFKNLKIRLLNVINLSLLVRSLIFFLSINLMCNSYSLFFCDLNSFFKFSFSNLFFEIEFSEFSENFNFF